MKRSSIQPLLLSKTKPLQVFLSLFGAFLGIFIMMAGIQFYGDMKSLMKQKDLLGGDYIVIHKKVGIFNTITGSKPGFSEQEMKEISGLDGIQKVSPFTSSSFKVNMELETGFGGMSAPAFKSILFFESVPNEFIDVNNHNWQWKSGIKKVPIILNEDFLNLYNTAFAQSQNLPVIPESVLQSVTFRLIITGNGQTETFDGAIAGFSKRINSILVPQPFMDYCNHKFGSGNVASPSRLIIHSKDPASPKLANQLGKLGYELNRDKLKSSELNNLLLTMIFIVFSVGFLIVLLALLGFIQYNQIITYRSAYEIQTLHWLGYTTQQISRIYIRFSIFSLAITCILAIAGLYGAHLAFQAFLVSKGFDPQLPPPGLAIASGCLISLLMCFLSIWSTTRQVRQLAIGM